MQLRKVRIKIRIFVSYFEIVYFSFVSYRKKENEEEEKHCKKWRNTKNKKINRKIKRINKSILIKQKKEIKLIMSLF